MPAASNSPVETVLTSPAGSIVVSILLGLGLAAVFRKACKGKHCVVVKAPPRRETDDYCYKVDQDCYRYSPRVTPCEPAGTGPGHTKRTYAPLVTP